MPKALDADYFFFSSRRRHTRWNCDWSSDVCSSDLGDMASVPHNYMLGAFVNGGIAGETAAGYCAEIDLPAHDPTDVVAEQERVLAPTRREDGLTPHEMEFKT